MKKEIAEDKKKKKKKNPILIAVIIVLAGVILWFEIGRGLEGSQFSFIEKFIVIILALIVIGIFIAFAALPRKIRGKFESWCKVIFTHMIWPLMFFAIIILGAISSQSHITSYPNGTFQQNINQSFAETMTATSGAFQEITMTFYNLGTNHADFWIFFAVLFIVYNIWVIKQNVEEDYLEKMNAQELIDSITDKDYKDLEEYEQMKEQKISNFKIIWMHLRGEGKRKEFIQAWLIVIVLAMVLIGGIWFWFH